jgi:phosphatidylserine/phosphatidylglycerophosphate/cardiolipin synthase-like enzyme
MQNKAIIVRPDYSWSGDSLGDDNPESLPVFRILVCGALKSGMHVTLQILEVDQRDTANQHSEGETIIGKITGKLKGTSIFQETHAYEIDPDHKSKEKRGAHACLGLLLEQAQSPTIFQLPIRKTVHRSSGDGKHYWFDGDYWEVKLKIPELALESPVFPVAWQRRVVPACFTESDHRQATYDWHAGNEIQFFTDASNDADGTSGAFHEILRAIRKAQNFIFIVDWSFHPTIFLDPTDRTLHNTLGALLLKKANADVLVAIHTWYHESHVAEHPNEDAYEIMLGMANRMGIRQPKNLLWRGSSRFASTWIRSHIKVFWSHHQKFIVLDSPGAGGRSEVRAFFGGLDLTKGRFDWHEHPLFADEPACARFRHPITQDGEPWLFNLHNERHHYDDWYNAEFGAYPTLEMLDDDRAADLHPREAWHDVHASVKGPLAWDFLREFAGRWVCRSAIEHEGGSADMVWEKFKDIMDRDRFTQQWELRPNSGPWSAQMLHSIVRRHIDSPQNNPLWNPKRQEFEWSIGGEDFEKSIQLSYLQAIGEAERFIYIENQYFIGSGDRWQNFSQIQNKIPEALVNRIIEKHRSNQPFHVYVVVPMIPEGNTICSASDKKRTDAIGLVSNHGVRSLEWQTMAWMINALKTAGLRWEEYLSFYWLAGGEGVSTRLSASAEIARLGRYPETLQEQLT